MIKNDDTMKSIAANVLDKWKSIYTEIMTKTNSYNNYLDEKLQSIEYDINVLRNIIDNSYHTDKLIKLKTFLQKNYPNIQAFDTPSICGDYRCEIYKQDGIRVLYAPKYEYIEIYGLTTKEFDSLIDTSTFENKLKTFDIKEE